LTVQIEFDDQSNNQLATDALNLTAMQHKAFLTTQNYPALKGQKGILRIHEGTDKVTVLGLLSNATNAITTIIPVTQ
jgi:ABC-type metal ion transport system substrate-binding protein